MKINQINLIMLIALLSVSCSQNVNKIVFKLEKNGSATVESVDDIVLKRYRWPENNSTLRLPVVYGSMKYPNEFDSRDNINDPYRVGFHYRLIGRETGMINYNLCSDGKSEHINHGYMPLVHNDEIHLYLPFEHLKELGLITDTYDKQQDICFYIKDTYTTMSEKYISSSNTLIYSASEINAVIAEYKALQ